jgi:hypothetical protein
MSTHDLPQTKPLFSESFQPVPSIIDKSKQEKQPSTPEEKRLEQVFSVIKLGKVMLDDPDADSDSIHKVTRMVADSMIDYAFPDKGAASMQKYALERCLTVVDRTIAVGVMDGLVVIEIPKTGAVERFEGEVETHLLSKKYRIDKDETKFTVRI